MPQITIFRNSASAAQSLALNMVASVMRIGISESVQSTGGAPPASTRRDDVLPTPSSVALLAPASNTNDQRNDSTPPSSVDAASGSGGKSQSAAQSLRPHPPVVNARKTAAAGRASVDQPAARRKKTKSPKARNLKGATPSSTAVGASTAGNAGSSTTSSTATATTTAPPRSTSTASSIVDKDVRSDSSDVQVQAESSTRVDGVHGASTAMDFIRELLQRVDDAGATEVSFLAASADDDSSKNFYAKDLYVTLCVLVDSATTLFPLKFL
jgi:hypothetical protein